MKKSNLIFIAIVLIAIAIIVFPSNKLNGNVVSGFPSTMYKSPTCGCCVKYAPYLENKDFDVDMKALDDMQPIKDQYQIPSEMESCHTLIVGDYFVA